tara:strand:- start:254 stop:544 length:291 start_codon:yes stop_codon:yes gene_type:complete
MSNELRDLIIQTQAAIKKDADKAKASFQTRSHPGDGLRSEVSIRQHDLVIDEQESLGGTDTGPNPVELVLTALGSCQDRRRCKTGPARTHCGTRRP